MKRKQILEDAIKCVCHDRQDAHGAPENTFEIIADMWSVYLAHKLDVEVVIYPADVAWMMVLLKTSRAISNPKHEDNATDAAGYAALAAEVTR